MQAEQALRALGQLKAAAPPATSARLGEIMTFLNQLEAENSALGRVEPDNTALRQLEVENAALKQQLDAFAANSLMSQVPDTLRPSMKVVYGHAEALIQGKFGAITTEQVESVRLIKEHAASALTLLESLEAISKLRQGQLQLESREFSGLELLANVWKRHAADAEPREHQINIKADDPLPNVRGDYKHVQAILSDLVDNAIRYTPFGGIIRVTAETLGTHVLFTVSDNGIGLSDDDTTQIGKPFWRAARQPLVRQHPGTGLRLYIARQVLQMHGSDLILSGEPGVGSSFSFLLAAG
ncbi:MAG: HAMP domain-containing sensor histidine kinase [Chloroflexota bacterium]